MLAFVLFSGSVLGDEESSYCDYTNEKYEAEHILLQSPKATFGGGRANVGNLNAIGLGVSESLSNYLKGRLSTQIGNQDCELFKHINEISKHVSYDLSSMQVAYAKNRINEIDDSIANLKTILQNEEQRLKVGSSTIITTDTIESAIQRQMVERAILSQQVAMVIIPEMKTIPLKQLLTETIEIEANQQQTIAKQAKYDNWDVNVSAGIGSQIKGFTPGATQPFGMVGFSYSFGASARNHALDASGNAYTEYVNHQTTGPIHLADQLIKQVSAAQLSAQDSLISYESYMNNLQYNLDSISGIDTPESHRFYIQLQMEITTTKVEIQSTKYNIHQMNAYLEQNFSK
jgi:hypothetical protein